MDFCKSDAFSKMCPKRKRTQQAGVDGARMKFLLLELLYEWSPPRAWYSLGLRLEPFGTLAKLH
jgi:hypothetical protein